MIASRQDGEITFYEELGVSPDASPEAIRNAFRLYVRLFHPDNQTDPQLKEIAGIQMRKFNRIHAVLSDAENRRRYDESLDKDYSPSIVLGPPTRDLPRLSTRVAWVAAIIVSAGLLLWLASDNAPASATASLGQAAHVSELQSDLQGVTVERDAAIRELEKLRGAKPKPPLTMTELPTASEP